jgi:hypothetical protein
MLFDVPLHKFIIFRNGIFLNREFFSLKVDADGFDSNLESVPDYSDRPSICLKPAIACSVRSGFTLVPCASSPLAFPKVHPDRP